MKLPSLQCVGEMLVETDVPFPLLVASASTTGLLCLLMANAMFGCICSKNKHLFSSAERKAAFLQYLIATPCFEVFVTWTADRDHSNTVIAWVIVQMLCVILVLSAFCLKDSFRVNVFVAQAIRLPLPILFIIDRLLHLGPFAMAIITVFIVTIFEIVLFQPQFLRIVEEQQVQQAFSFWGRSSPPRQTNDPPPTYKVKSSQNLFATQRAAYAGAGAAALGVHTPPRSSNGYGYLEDESASISVSQF